MQAGFEWLLSFLVKTRGSLSIVIQLTVQVIRIDELYLYSARLSLGKKGYGYKRLHLVLNA